MQELDPRIVRVGIEINGKVKYYEGLAITAAGMKYANPIQNECEIKIDNIDRETRDYILTETSPFNLNRKPKRMFLEAGRVSYGTTQVFVGNITTAEIGQPPDITLTLKSLTHDFYKGQIIGRTGGAIASLKQIAKGAADDMDLNLNFQATDKNISNYSYSGSALKQVDALSDVGGVDAYIDDTQLVVKDYNVPLTGKLRKLDLTSGMIGIPELTEQGVRVKFLLDNQTTLGGALEINSQIYPAINGQYVIYKLGFVIASRDVPFYWIAEGKRMGNPNA